MVRLFSLYTMNARLLVETIGILLQTKIIRKLFIDKCGFVIFPLLLCERRKSVRRPSPAQSSIAQHNERK